MKKTILIIFLVLLIGGSSLFAYTFPEFFYPETSFRPISARTEAMGGAGIATATGNDALFMNPANLGSRKFSLNLPSISLTVFNPKAVIDEGIIEEIQNNSGSDTMAANVITKYMNIVKAGKGEVLTTDLALSFTGGGFGLGFQFQEQLHTISSDGSMAADKFLAEVNAATTMGVGFRLNFIPDIISVDLGASARFTYKAYSKRIGATELINIMQAPDPAAKFMAESPIAAGWAVPIDVGVNVNLPVGLRVSMVARDLNAKYTMQNYSESGLWLNEMAEFVGMSGPYNDASTGDNAITEFSYTVPWKLDLGFGWTPDLGGFGKILRPSLALDLVDTVAMFEEGADDPNAYWNYFKAGAELKLVSMIDLRAGFNRGYYSIGVGLDLFVLRVDASYYWREYGPEIGDKPIDALTVRVNLGIDR